MRGIRGVNKTTFFNRELLLYSFGDVSFKKPISIRRFLYTLAGIILWTIPIFFTFGLIFNPYYLIILLAPPFIIGYYAVEPFFFGKTLIGFTKTMIIFSTEPKRWTDFFEDRTNTEEEETIDEEIWVSRRRELKQLAQLKEEEYNEQL